MKRTLAHSAFSVLTALLMLFTALPREWYHHCDHDEQAAETGVSELEHDCPVCDYVFFTSFVSEAEVQEASVEASFEQKLPNYLPVFFQEIALSNGLRGPPTA